MSEYIVCPHCHNPLSQAEYVKVVRCKDCKHLDFPDWDNILAEQYGEPPAFCMRLSDNEWRNDGDRMVAETSFLEVSMNDYCKWGERKEAGA